MKLRQLAFIPMVALGLLASQSIAVASTTIWVGDERGQLGTVHATTGQVHWVGDMGVVMSDIAISSTGHMFGISFDSLYRINPLTAVSTKVGDLGTSLNSLAFSTNGKLYGANDSLWTINVLNGNAENLGNKNTSYWSQGDLAYFNGTLYLAGDILGSAGLFRLNPADGEGTFIGSLDIDGVLGLASDDTTLYALAGKNVYAVDPISGDTTLLSTFSGPDAGVLAATWGAATVPVPEPSSYALLLAGLTVMALLRTRRTKH